MICWAPDCTESDVPYGDGCCDAHFHEAANARVWVLTEPWHERCDEWHDLHVARRAIRENGEQLLRKQRAERQQAKWRLTGRVPDATDTVEAIRDDLARDIAAGSRNAAINRAGYRLGRLVGGGTLTRTEAVAILEQQAQAHRLPHHEAKYVIARSLDDGSDNPYVHGRR